MVIVKESKVNGTGVFAAKDFAVGDVVVPWGETKSIDESELSTLTEKERHYVSAIGGGRYIQFPEPACYVNHSCDPNTVAQNRANVALRAISADEEITTDYDLEGAQVEFICTCGSVHCRGTIGAASI